MEAVTIEASPIIEIPETAATNEIVPYTPPQATAIEPAGFSPDSDIVEATWRVVDDQPNAGSQNRLQGEQSAPYIIEASDWWNGSNQQLAPTAPKPYTLNQQLADEAQRNGWLFERPTNHLTVGQQLSQARTQPATLSRPQAAAEQRTQMGTPVFLGTLVGLGMDGIGRCFDWLFNLFTFGVFGGSNAAPAYTAAPKVLFVTRLDFGETLGAYLVGEGLPLQVEGAEQRKANMPEYIFSLSANHLRWGLRLMRDFGV